MPEESAIITVTSSLRAAWEAFDAQYPDRMPTVTREAAEELYFELAQALQVAPAPKTQKENDILIAEAVVEELRSGNLKFNLPAEAAAEVAERIRRQ